MLTAEVDWSQLKAKLDELQARGEDPAKPLRAWLKHLKQRAIERVKAQDFAPLAASTVEHRAQKGMRRVGAKLRQDARKALGRAQEKEPRGFLARLLGVESRSVAAVETRGVRNRLSVLAEYERRFGKRSGLTSRTDLKPLTLKQHLSLGGRIDRAVAKAVGGPILGGLVRMMKARVKGADGELVERSRGGWTEIHNKGGTGGHGAKIPKRETLKVEDSDIEFGAALFEEHLIEPFTR